MRYRRCLFCHFAFADDSVVDLYALMRGEYRSSQQVRLFALSPLTGLRTAVTIPEVELISSLPVDDWLSAEDFFQLGADLSRFSDLAWRGVVLCDGEAPELVRLRQRSEVLSQQQWQPQAALLHFMARGSEDRQHEETPDYEALEVLSLENAADFIRRFGPPPEPFLSKSERQGFRLPRVEGEGEFYEVLERRRTTRLLDVDRPLPLGDLATLLRYSLGWYGQTRIAPEILLLHRTSPSGGARHPVEGYVLAQNVEGLAPGIYHYRAHEHSLDAVRILSREEARSLALEFAEGQSYVASMHAIVILTARFFRNQWKYRKNIRTYSVILMDAAHISQTFYLVATQRGLGAFFSAAVNSPRVDGILGIDGYEEGSVGLLGCGVKLPGDGVGELPFEDWAPGDDAS